MFIRKKEKGFTLVELMIVGVIIGILASIAIPKFSALISKTKVTEAKTLLRQIINLEKSFYQLGSVYSTIATGADNLTIGFVQPDATSRRFEYKFDIVGASPFVASIATATENQDVSGNGVITDGLTLSVADVEATIGDGSLVW